MCPRAVDEAPSLKINFRTWFINREIVDVVF